MFKRERGFGLVEVMIAVTLGLMVIAIITSVFVSSNRNYNEDDKVSRLQENGRFAIKLLSNDLTMASFWGTLTNTAVTSTLADCNVTLNTTNPLVILDQRDATVVNSTFNCIDSNEYYLDPEGASAYSDVLLVKRVQGQISTPPLDSIGRAYLQINNGIGTVNWMNSGSALTASATYWEYIAYIYYIRNYSVTPTDGIPTLCRKYLIAKAGSAVKFSEEPLVEGIENFQIEFGVDTNNDGLVDQYQTNPANMALAVTARIYVLARALTEDPNYTNDKKFNLGSTLVNAKDDGYFRRVFSTNVSLRNVANFAALGRS